MNDQNNEISEETLEQDIRMLEDSLPNDDSEELSIDDIIAEFHEDAPEDSSDGAPVTGDTPEEAPPVSDAPTQEVPIPEAGEAVEEADSAPEENAAAPSEEAQAFSQETASDPKAAFEENPISSGPIIFKPRYRGSEMRKQIVNGPERRYYELQEMGLGKLQFAILFCALAFFLSAGTTVLYHLGVNVETHLRLYVFSQVFCIFIAVIFGCYLLMDGIADMFRGHFSLGTLLSFTVLVCAADCLICLKRMWLPFGSVLCLEISMALWGTYCKRVTEMGQTDTLRKANYLDALVRVPDLSEGKAGFRRRDGLISDYTEAYKKPSAPERVQSCYAISALVLSMAIGGLAYYRMGGDYAVHIMTGSMLCALPATFFLSIPRPAAILEHRLHKLGALICGWKGTKGLCKKGVYPLADDDLFPGGCLTLNGVKFYGETPPEQILGYAAALAEAQESHWSPVFRNLSDSRNAQHYDVEEFVFYDNGGVGGIMGEDAVLMGSRAFMKEMNISIPSGNQVDHPLYLSIGGEICAVFALSYRADRLAAAGLSTLIGCRRVTGVYTGSDTLVDGDFIRGLYRMKPKRLQFPPFSSRFQFTDPPVPEDSAALMLTIRNHLASRAYCISGAKALRGCTILGIVLHILAGVLGLLAAAAIAFLGNTELFTAGSVLLYSLLWLIPGFVITEWTRFL